MSEWTLECLILAEACVVYIIREQLDEVSPTQKWILPQLQHLQQLLSGQTWLMQCW
jgi:hypothetical protein